MKLIEKNQPEAQDKDTTKKKLDEKKETSDLKPISSNTGTNQNINIVENDRTEKKEESIAVSHSDVMEQSDDDRRKREQVKGKREFSEKELDTKIYITLSETQTTFMYFAPSQKYFTNKNGNFVYLNNYNLLILFQILRKKMRKEKKKLISLIKINVKILSHLLVEEHKQLIDLKDSN